MTMAFRTPGPWVYQYNPYTSQDGKEIPAFEVYGEEKVCDTNEDRPCEEQEANARLAVLNSMCSYLRQITSNASPSPEAVNATNSPSDIRPQGLCIVFVVATIPDPKFFIVSSEGLSSMSLTWPTACVAAVWMSLSFGR